METSSCAPEKGYCRYCFAIEEEQGKKVKKKVAKIVWKYKTDMISLVWLFSLWTKADGLECCHNNYAVILLMTWLLCHMSLGNEMEHSNIDDGKMGRWQNPATKDKISQEINVAVRRVVCLCLLENYHEGNLMSDRMSPPSVPQRLRD